MQRSAISSQSSVACLGSPCSCAPLWTYDMQAHRMPRQANYTGIACCGRNSLQKCSKKSDRLFAKCIAANGKREAITSKKGPAGALCQLGPEMLPCTHQISSRSLFASKSSNIFKWWCIWCVVHAPFILPPTKNMKYNQNTKYSFSDCIKWLDIVVISLTLLPPIAYLSFVSSAAVKQAKEQGIKPRCSLSTPANKLCTEDQLCQVKQSQSLKPDHKPARRNSREQTESRNTET